MRISDLIRSGGPTFSFEFFPPRDEAAAEQLFEAIRLLQRLEPSFVSVTYGAGGSTRERTVELVAQLEAETGVPAMAHFAVVGSSRDELLRQLDTMRAAGIENVLALRGDRPRDAEGFVEPADRLEHASDLIRLIKSEYDFCVGAAAHPEKHPEAPDGAVDLAHLKEKVDAGADFLITQLFFDNAHYFGFVERARAAGIMVPIVPGIMPITNVDQVERFTRLCGATLPPALREALEMRRDNPQAVVNLGVAYAALQCAELLRRGAPGIHFYTLNRQSATAAILRALRLQEPWRVA